MTGCLHPAQAKVVFASELSAILTNPTPCPAQHRLVGNVSFRKKQPDVVGILHIRLNATLLLYQMFIKVSANLVQQC